MSGLRRPSLRQVRSDYVEVNVALVESQWYKVVSPALWGRARFWRIKTYFSTKLSRHEDQDISTKSQMQQDLTKCSW